MELKQELEEKIVLIILGEREGVEWLQQYKQYFPNWESMKHRLTGIY